MYTHIHVSTYVFVSLFMLHLHANFHVLGSIGSLIIAPNMKLNIFFSTSRMYFYRMVITSVLVTYLSKIF